MTATVSTTLTENAIQVFDGGDNQIDEKDYVLFYAEGAVGWKQDASTFKPTHFKNTSNDSVFYFVTLGLVVERRRPPHETEHLMFYCEKCEALVYDKEFACSDIVTHFRKAMEAFWADPALCTCKSCGTRVPKPASRTE